MFTSVPETAFHTLSESTLINPCCLWKIFTCELFVFSRIYMHKHSNTYIWIAAKARKVFLIIYRRPRRCSARMADDRGTIFLYSSHIHPSWEGGTYLSGTSKIQLKVTVWLKKVHISWVKCAQSWLRVIL